MEKVLTTILFLPAGLTALWISVDGAEYWTPFAVVCLMFFVAFPVALFAGDK